MAEIILVEGTAYNVIENLNDSQFDGKITNTDSWLSILQELYTTYGSQEPLPNTYKFYLEDHVWNGDSMYVGYAQQVNKYWMTFGDSNIVSDGTILIFGEEYTTGVVIADGDVIKLTVEQPLELSKVNLDGTLYNIKDSKARQQIADLPKPMIFKGSLGTGGTITSLPTPSDDFIGYTYKVITEGTYDGKQAKVGDLFICNDTPEWVLIPSGDDTGGSGTVTNIATGTGLTGGPITTSGTISVDFENVQAKLVSGTNIKTINNTSILGSGNINIESSGEYLAGLGIEITDDASGKTISSTRVPLTSQEIANILNS